MLVGAHGAGLAWMVAMNPGGSPGMYRAHNFMKIDHDCDHVETLIVILDSEQ